MTNLPDKIYTESEVERARNSAQLVGWAQGAGVVIGAGILWSLLGWIPVVLGVGAVGWVGYKLFGPKTEDEGEGASGG
jgi:hypothetical protein